MNIEIHQDFVSCNVFFHETFKDTLANNFDDSLFTRSVLPVSTHISLDNTTSQPVHTFSIPPAVVSVTIPSSTIPRKEYIVTSGVGQVSQPIARSRRQCKSHSYLANYHCFLTESISSASNISSKLYPISSVLNYTHLKTSHQSFILSCTLEIKR